MRQILAISFVLFFCAFFYSPAGAQGIKIESPVDGMLSDRDKLSVITWGIPGFPIALSVNGTAADTQQVRADMKADFLNISAPSGPVVLKIQQTLDGGVSFADSVHIHVIGPAAKIVIDDAHIAIPADTLAQTSITVGVVDAWDIPLPDGHYITAQLHNGKILTPDIYPDQPGVQTQLKNGNATVLIQAPNTVGEGILHITANGITVEKRLNYTIPSENWTVVGMATGQIGYQKQKINRNDLTTNEDFQKGIYTNGKAAFYARGTVGKDYHLMSSLDTDRKFNDQVFRFLTPEQVYPIYGDASSIFYEAPSASRLFIRLSKDQSYLQYGDYATGLSQNELANYNRTFTGVSSFIKKQKSTWTVFGAATEQAIQVDEIPGEGISGHYYLSAQSRGVPIVAGSERVVLQTRDRLHPEQIVRELPQYRFTDYDIDYSSGTLLFKRPVASHSTEEHPIFIVVTYETVQSIERHLVAGGRVVFHPNRTWQVGTTLVGEGQTNDNYWLTALDTRWHPQKNVTITSELARSQTAKQGWAWKLGLRAKSKSKLDYELYYREAKRDFYNPSSPTASPGLRKFQGRFTWLPTDKTILKSEAFHTSDNVSGEKRASFAVGSDYHRGAFTHKASLEISGIDRRGTKSQNTTLNAGIEWAIAPAFSVRAERDQSFGKEDLNYRPTLNRLGAQWALNDRVDIVAEHAFRDNSLIHASYTTLGLQSRIVDDLTAYAKYELDGGINRQQNQAIVGLRHQYRPHPDFTLHTSFERIHTLRGNTQADFYAYTFAGEYLPPKAIKTSVRFEKRNGNALDKTVASYAADWALNRGLSWLGKHTYLHEQLGATTPTQLRSHHILSGLAYRPHFHDLINALGKYEYKYQRNTLLQPAITQSTHMGSLEAIFEPRSQLEWFVRYAFKVSYLFSEGISSKTLTDLWMTNFRYEWTQSWDTQVEYRILSQHTSRSYQHGASLEMGHILQQNMRLAVGYNFLGQQDRDFSGVAYWAQGPYVKIQIKFLESDVAGLLDGLQVFLRE